MSVPGHSSPQFIFRKLDRNPEVYPVWTHGAGPRRPSAPGTEVGQAQQWEPACRSATWGGTHDLVLHVPVELMDLLGGQQVLLPLVEGLQQLHELGLHGEALAVHLVRALPLLAQGLCLALELFYLLLPHLHLILQHLRAEDTPTFTPETRETQWFYMLPFGTVQNRRFGNINWYSGEPKKWFCMASKPATSAPLSQLIFPKQNKIKPPFLRIFKLGSNSQVYLGTSEANDRGNKN